MSYLIKYATCDERGWNEAYGSPRTFSTGLVCGRDEPVYELVLEEVDENEDWDFVGWRDFRDAASDVEEQEVSLIWPDFRAFEMCFTYGPFVEVEAGRGEIVYMRLVKYKEIGLAGEL